MKRRWMAACCPMRMGRIQIRVNGPRAPNGRSRGCRVNLWWSAVSSSGLSPAPRSKGQVRSREETRTHPSPQRSFPALQRTYFYEFSPLCPSHHWRPPCSPHVTSVQQLISQRMGRRLFGSHLWFCSIEFSLIRSVSLPPSLLTPLWLWFHCLIHMQPQKFNSHNFWWNELTRKRKQMASSCLSTADAEEERSHDEDHSVFHSLPLRALIFLACLNYWHCPSVPADSADSPQCACTRRAGQTSLRALEGISQFTDFKWIIYFNQTAEMTCCCLPDHNDEKSNTTNSRMALTTD